MPRKIQSTFEKPKRVEVIWLDSQESGDASWEDPDDMKVGELEGMEVRTFAYLVFDLPDRIVLSHSLTVSGMVNRTFEIPKTAIIKLSKDTFTSDGNGCLFKTLK